MRVVITKRFKENSDKIRNPDLLEQIYFVIETAQEAETPLSVPDCKKLTGCPEYYRIVIGTYRIGVKASGDTIRFICCLHRSIVYHQFPKKRK